MTAIQTETANDASLLARVEQGDKNAFTELYEKYWDWAYNTAYKRLKDEQGSKDIVQEIFVHLWMKRDTHIDNLPAYLNRAIMNRVIKSVTRQKRFHPFFNILESLSERKVHADSNLLFKELSKSYETLLSSLPPKRQMIFRLRFQEELPTKEIATKLSLSRKTVQNQLTRAIEQIRAFL